MNANEPGPSRPTPKPPASGADAWKNQPTNCWPTPANMAKARDLRAPLEPASDERQSEQASEDTWEGEGGSDDEAPQTSAHPQAAALSDDATAGDTRPQLGADPAVPERFRATVERLDELPGRPVAEHAESYDAVHRELRQTLDGIERPS